MLRLLKNLYLDVHKFQKIEVPSETAIWGEIPEVKPYGKELIEKISDDKDSYNYLLKKSKSRVPSAFEKLKLFCAEYLRKTKGCIYID